MDEWSVILWCLILLQSGHLMLVSYMSSIMVRLSLVDKARAIGQLVAGIPHTQGGANFGVSQSMILKLKSSAHRPRSGHPKKTTLQQGRYITLSALQNRRITAYKLQRFQNRLHGRDFQSRNRLHAAYLKERRPAWKPAMTSQAGSFTPVLPLSPYAYNRDFGSMCLQIGSKEFEKLGQKGAFLVHSAISKPKIDGFGARPS